MKFTDIKNALIKDVPGKEVKVLDADGNVYEVTSIQWDEDNDCYFIKVEIEDEDAQV